MLREMPRLIVAGTHSGCGKTTLTLALLEALRHDMSLTALKCGPDFIDPLFHQQISGVAARQLDAFFCPGEALTAQLLRGAGRDLTVIEGVMGYYDGIGLTSEASTWQIACQTDSPVVLTVSGRGMGLSLAALLQGFASFRQPSQIRAVVFNQVSPRAYDNLAAIARQVGLEPLGYLPPLPELALQSRYLGLVTPDEVVDLRSRLIALGVQAKQSLDLAGLVRLARSAPPVEARAADRRTSVLRAPVRLAVARDEAFCFLYADSLELLRELGAELVFFSPLRDPLPQHCGGLLLCGGYPELHAEVLSANRTLRGQIAAALAAGMPTIAECGGFLYLHERLAGRDMVGFMPGEPHAGDRLGHFGYITLEARRDGLLGPAGSQIRAHEYHYWRAPDEGDGFVAHKAGRADTWPCLHSSATLLAGFPHLYLPACPEAAANFLRKAEHYAS